IVADCFARRSPTLVTDAHRQLSELAERLGTRSALLLPLLRGGDRVGLLTIGFHSPPTTGTVEEDGIEVGDAFITALELLHLRQAEQLQRDVRELLDEFTASLAATLNLAAGLDIFCVGANRLFGADRTSVWIHERRARQLVLQASSDTADVSRGVRVSTEDLSAPAAVSMRRIRSEIVPSPDD